MNQNRMNAQFYNTFSITKHQRLTSSFKLARATVTQRSGATEISCHDCLRLLSHRSELLLFRYPLLFSRL